MRLSQRSLMREVGLHRGNLGGGCTWLVDYIGDVAFIKATGAIGGHDAMEEYLACGLYPLSTGLNLREVADSIMQVSKLKVPLPKFCVVCSDKEDNAKFWRGLN
jgi:hypothetical protein